MVSVRNAMMCMGLPGSGEVLYSVRARGWIGQGQGLALGSGQDLPGARVRLRFVKG